ncbi:hypothetical protein [Streptomyces albicerus]|uniref:hypothetical protein n=1 Tax=Streptomyces albicerus TaxID=2569859 RepID=UPI001788ACF2|nr:hypothetical protein [Streptomyces albicerus]
MQSPTISEPSARPLPGDTSRPRLRSDALWVPHDDGAFLLCNASSLTIRGKSSYELVSRIAPHLDGTKEVGRLLSGLSPAVAEQVRVLLRRLEEAGFVRDAATDRPHGLTDRELVDYAGELAFIEYFRDSPAARYEAFRDTPVLCVGAGLVFDGLVRAMVQLGNRRTTAVLTGPASERPGYESAVETARERDPSLSLRTALLPSEKGATEGELADLIETQEIVLHFADDFDPRLARRLDAWCAQAGTTVLHGVVAGDDVWLGPTCEPGARVRGPDLWAEAGLDGTGRRSAFLAEPTARIVAAQLAFAVFKALTGVPADDFRERAVRVDLATLVTQEVNLASLDRLTADDRDSAEPGESEEPGEWFAALPPTESERAELSQVFSRLVDGTVGLIRNVDEEALAQIPLHRCRAEVALPAAPGRSVEAVGDGLDLAAARVGAVLAAAESASLHGTLGTAGRAAAELVEAVDLATGEPVTVPYHLVHDDNARMSTASAAAWSVAAASALGRAARRLLRDGPYGEGTRCTPAGPDVPRLLHILEAAGHRPTLRTLCDADGYAIVRADCGSGLVGVGAGPSAATAGGDALYDAVRGLHEQVNGEPTETITVGGEPAAIGDESAVPGHDPGGTPHTDAAGSTIALARAARWLAADAMPPASRLLALSLETHPVLRAAGRTHCVAVLVVPAGEREAS